MINLAFASFMPSEFITHLEASPELMAHIGLELFSYATLIIAMLYTLQFAWLDLFIEKQEADHQRRYAAADGHRT